MRTATLLWLLSSSALAQAPAAELSALVPATELRTFVNLRGGASTGHHHAEICLEASPLAPIALEACGTGSGFLHNDPSAQLAHFRAKFNLRGLSSELGLVQPQLFIGFAELQAGDDDPGFIFNGVGPHGIETAGPEAGLGLRTLYGLGGGFELVATLNLAVAYLAHAPRLRVPVEALQPSVSFTVGVGF